MEKIGTYRILSEVGRGTTGVVYRAEDSILGRTVAIKTIEFVREGDPLEQAMLRKRLLQEARAAAGLSHPNILTIHQLAEESDFAYIVMEYIDGPTLEKWMTPATDYEAIVEVLRQAASGLDFAHRKGIVHRDIKPANIMIDESGAVKIADFGLAQAASRGEAGEKQGERDGSPYFMSPEQVQKRPLTGQSDQFSLAVIAYWMLTGVRPFNGDSLAPVLYKIVNENPPPAQMWNPMLPPNIGSVIETAMAKNPAGRFPTCGEFLDALEAAFGMTPAAKPSTNNRLRIYQEQETPQQKRHHAMVTLATCAGGIGILAIVWFLLEWQGRTTPATRQQVSESSQRPTVVLADPPPAAPPTVKTVEHPVTKDGKPSAAENDAAAPERVYVKQAEQEQKLISRPPPVYPPAAKASGLEGEVLLSATIDQLGKVKYVKPLYGHPDLIDAAVKAVEQSLYKPTLIDGAAVEVQTNVVVHFALR